MINQAPLFDTLLAVEALQKNGGFDAKQAKAIVSLVDQSLTSGVATKADLAEVRNELKAEMEKQELRLKIWVGWGLFIAVGVSGGIIAYSTNLILSAVAG